MAWKKLNGASVVAHKYGESKNEGFRGYFEVSSAQTSLLDVGFALTWPGTMCAAMRAALSMKISLSAKRNKQFECWNRKGFIDEVYADEFQTKAYFRKFEFYKNSKLDTAYLY